MRQAGLQGKGQDRKGSAGRGYARLDLACPGVGVAIKMRPRQAKHYVYVYILHVFRISHTGYCMYICVCVCVCVGYMLYGFGSAW